MAKYRARDHWREILSTRQGVFTNNIQTLLALSAISLFIVSILWDYVWRCGEMTPYLTPANWLGFIFGGLLVSGFFILGVVAFFGFLITIWKGWFGENFPDDTKEVNESDNDKNRANNE